jgi:hypothetical protein
MGGAITISYNGQIQQVPKTPAGTQVGKGSSTGTSFNSVSSSFGNVRF